MFALTVSPAHNTSVKCDRMRSQKLRRRPDSCHAFHPESILNAAALLCSGSQENAQECGGASDTSAWLPLLLLPLCACALPSQLLR
ncbi:Voltage-dependent calcium channel subunit alpha-2/delta-4 [Galemys pyrenaicus]|uniref:Voltage-dependent calcium channel subunit alpha-2/delta-4 n=1 Tax=Galemys pyrenaicus TaxID=202257 RepID=A0A8J5ZWK9_GALPY|nr:Voltage-dependent calcium channel subunit alpha-2/delta-4 [Galemys pyrenaicus]